MWLDVYHLSAASEDELHIVLASVFGDAMGNIVESSHEHSILYPRKLVETGVMLSDSDGKGYPEMVLADGYYADVYVREPVPALNAYAIEPNPSVADYYEKQAQALLSELESSNVIIEAVEYQVRQQDIDRINQKIGWMQRNAIESVEWIVADNTTETCTVDDLYKILDAQQARQDSAIQQYTEWRLGDKQTPFEPTI